MLTKLLIPQYWLSDNPRNFYQQILPQKLSINFTQKIWHYGTPNHSPEEPQRKRKNGDIMLTRPGQIRENTKTAERTTPWQKYERQKKTGGKEEIEKRIFE